MTHRDTASFGKRIEYSIIGRMLMEGLDVYTPIVDDHGVDCVIKKLDGTFVEIQIKARSGNAKQNGVFTVDKHDEIHDNYFFVFYAECAETTWVFSSEDFLKESRVNKGGKNAGRHSIRLLTPSGKPRGKFEKYSVETFELLH